MTSQIVLQGDAAGRRRVVPYLNQICKHDIAKKLLGPLLGCEPQSCCSIALRQYQITLHYATSIMADKSGAQEAMGEANPTQERVVDSPKGKFWLRIKKSRHKLMAKQYGRLSSPTRPISPASSPSTTRSSAPARSIRSSRCIPIPFRLKATLPLIADRSPRSA